MPFRLLIQDEINPGKPIWIFGSMLLFSCGFGYAMARDMVAGFGALGFILSIGAGLICMVSEEAGLYLALVYSFFIYYFSRLLFTDDFPVGSGLEGMLLLTLLGMVIRRVPLRQHFQNFARSAIGRCVLILLIGYNLLEVANPYGQSLLGWFQVIRKAIDMVIVLFICFTVFNSTASIKKYIKSLFIVTTIVALYGCFQQWHGLLPFEKNWILEDPTRTDLMYIGGEYRKFSTMSDPKGFGIIMAASGVFFLILTMGQAKAWRRILLLGSTVCMLLGMSYSGTRTANAMVVGGALIFIILTIDKQSTRIFAVFATAIFLLLMYAPIHGNATLFRFRRILHRPGGGSGLRPALHLRPSLRGRPGHHRRGRCKICPGASAGGIPPGQRLPGKGARERLDRADFLHDHLLHHPPGGRIWLFFLQRQGQKVDLRGFGRILLFVLRGGIFPGRDRGDRRPDGVPSPDRHYNEPQKFRFIQNQRP